jgi:lipopolysaccharide export system protein LptA
MMYYRRFTRILQVASCLAAVPAMAQTSNGLQKNQPIEISSDKLDVFQEQHKAIFSGNVIAVQGTTNLRAATMTVFYRDSNTNKSAKKAAKDEPAAVPTPAAGAANAQGIYRIEAQTGVVFTTPTETAVGDTGIYNEDEETIDLTGNNVTLTQGQNVLKGNHVIHNMVTGRSILTSGNGVATDVTHGTTVPKSARVHGLFIPQSDDQKAGVK